jgi:hypothetical protein
MNRILDRKAKGKKTFVKPKSRWREKTENKEH